MTITADTPLFDLARDIARPTIIHTDAPRTRRTDPATSHNAGDISQANLSTIKAHVLFVMAKSGANGLTGQEINDLYTFTRSRLGWDRCHFDSPRKRAAELVEDGYLEVTGTRAAPGRGQSSIESVYALTDLGRTVNRGGAL